MWPLSYFVLFTVVLFTFGPFFFFFLDRYVFIFVLFTVMQVYVPTFHFWFLD